MSSPIVTLKFIGGALDGMETPSSVAPTMLWRMINQHNMAEYHQIEVDRTKEPHVYTYQFTGRTEAASH